MTDPNVEAENWKRRSPVSRTTTSIVWFVMGAVVSWGAWALMSYAGDRPRDHATSWSEWLREEGPGWVKHSRSRTLGHFTIIVAADPSQAAAIIQTNPDDYPAVTYSDENRDGVVDNMLVVCAGGRSWSFIDEDSDGQFDSYSYSTGITDGSFSLWDNDMDGTYDVRLRYGPEGPERGFAVLIGSEWHDVIFEASKRYVTLDGELVEIAHMDGGWEIVK